MVEEAEEEVAVAVALPESGVQAASYSDCL